MKFNPEGEARHILERERRYAELCDPTPEPVFLDWRSAIYIGAVQALYKECPELVYLTKSIETQGDDLIAELRKLGDKRPALTADDDLDISGSGYFLRRLGNRLTKSTPEQKKYIEENPFGTVKIILP